MNEKAVIGISGCLVGKQVRYDGSAKTSHFCVKELAQHVELKPFCPEVAIGLPVPRPTIRQIRTGDVITVSRPDGSGDVTAALAEYGEKVAKIAHSFSGYIFCAKSPSCGMERVKVYQPDGKGSTSDGVGVFAKAIMEANPLLPCEENGRLNDAIIRENFVARVFVYHQWQQLEASGLTKHKLIQFHSKYKYMLMSHSYAAYKALGRLLAQANSDVASLAHDYIAQLMNALKQKPTRKNHSNTLQHLQGYFSKYLTQAQRAELTQTIADYRAGLVPLLVPLTLIKHYLLCYPSKYLKQQVYFSPYPESLRLRYGY